MPTYREIKLQIAELEKKAEEARKLEAAKVITSIRAQVAKFSLTAEDIFGEEKASAPAIALPAAKTVVAPTAKKTPAKTEKADIKPASSPKYKDPKSGKTWTGHGKQPAWFNAAKKDSFLIKATPVATPVIAAAKPAAKLVAKKGGVIKAPVPASKKPLAKKAVQAAPKTSVKSAPPSVKPAAPKAKSPAKKVAVVVAPVTPKKTSAPTAKKPKATPAKFPPSPNRVTETAEVAIVDEASAATAETGAQTEQSGA